MPGPGLESLGQVVGLVGIGWVTFTVVSFSELKKKGDALAAAQRAQQPPAAKLSAPPSKALGFKAKPPGSA
jgi:hypothetical protein